jgi:N-acetyl sugar amidotransferase
MRYCRTCVTPCTRPNIRIDEKGNCNCATSATKAAIDWPSRKQAFEQVVANAKLRSKGHDCVIPVSGGKDSTWQVVQCLEYGLNPLAVTWRTPARTAVGQRNLDNLISLGVDHIDFQINPRVEKKFMYQALVRYGATAIPMHMAMFNIPLRIAVKFDIPLVIWGENSAFEYGGEDENKGFRLDASWLKRFGVTHGTTARDWISPELTEKELTPYFGPSDEELAAKDVSAIFLGYYFQWDPVMTYEVAARHGFQRATGGARTGYYDFADIDDDFISIHHWLKWYKFGFTRTWDNLSLEIRNGRMTREQAVAILRGRGDETPRADIARFCQWVGITEQHFFQVIEKFRNPEVWENRGGTWAIRDFLIPDWTWS